jgi:beta-lactamase superfamily II metal-dependent hydrolase
MHSSAPACCHRAAERVALTALIIAGALACCVATRTDAPEIWTFDVGAGDAALLRFPQTASFLVDAGGPGASLVRAILTAGAPVVPSVFVTHPHEDHVRGIETVARMLGVRSVWGPRGWCSDPAGATAASIRPDAGPVREGCVARPSPHVRPKPTGGRCLGR